MANNTIVTMRHVRMAGQCSRGLRAFALANNLDWDTFLKDGIPIEQVRALGDAMGDKIADIAEAEAALEGEQHGQE